MTARRFTTEGPACRCADLAIESVHFRDIRVSSRKALGYTMSATDLAFATINPLRPDDVREKWGNSLTL